MNRLIENLLFALRLIRAGTHSWKHRWRNQIRLPRETVPLCWRSRSPFNLTSVEWKLINLTKFRSIKTTSTPVTASSTPSRRLYRNWASPTIRWNWLRSFHARRATWASADCAEATQKSWIWIQLLRLCTWRVFRLNCVQQCSARP